MKFNGFTQEDFHVFTINGLEDRMTAIQEQIRPKLDYLGDHFAPTLSALTGTEMFYHVAKHARRSVNPPDDTWVAFANNKRGYKKHPHFQIGLWETHVFIWFAMIYEAPNKVEFGKKVEENADKIRSIIPGHFVWSGDHTKPDAIPFSSMSQDEFIALSERVQNVKKAELLCGLHLDRDTAVKLNGDEFIHEVNSAFETLLPLYKMN
ncbi:YktB family protein [Rossellomorea sp. NPDC071047]|uniref:YktB family protein n=1 Tax=Rossellomorea sp. NPDC071047 TaxID=3390675 RepID=UPI003CFD233E